MFIHNIYVGHFCRSADRRRRHGPATSRFQAQRKPSPEASWRWRARGAIGAGNGRAAIQAASPASRL